MHSRSSSTLNAASQLKVNARFSLLNDAAKKHLRPVARQPLEVVRDKLAAITDWTAENVHHAIQATADELEVGMGKVGMPLRVAVTGAGQSPALDVTVHAIGKTRSIERINKALAFIAERENQQ